MINPLRIVFMGTPEFAVASLDALCNSTHHVVTVVTAPDKPASRGLKIHSSAVKEYALQRNIPILQPENLKDPVFLMKIKELSPDIQVVVAFRMLPEAVWKLPRFGTINLHASLLPQYRGAAPINRAIMNGEKETGVTTFFINSEIDSGDILMQERVPISDNDNAAILHDRLMMKGASLLVKTVDGLSTKTLKPIRQQSFSLAVLKTAPKIFRNDCRINWNSSSKTIYDFVRGLSPYPGAWTEFIKVNETVRHRTVLKIYKCSPADYIPGNLGSIMISGQDMYASCSGGRIQLLELQQEGKKRMSAAEFLRGFQNEGLEQYQLL